MKRARVRVQRENDTPERSSDCISISGRKRPERRMVPDQNPQKKKILKVSVLVHFLHKRRLYIKSIIYIDFYVAKVLGR